MQNRGWMEVDLRALVSNAAALKKRAGVPIIPMVKADAYGLGAIAVAKALEILDPAAYGVAALAEGVELREAGITRPIIVFTPLLEADFPAVREASLIPTLGSARAIKTWSEEGGEYDLSIDTGMSRAGLSWREVAQIADVIREHPARGAFTHFHSANLNDASMRQQEERFASAIAELPVRPIQLHTDSSAAIARHGRSHWDAVRPGIFMYGVGSGEGARIEPECVVELKAPVVETRWIESGDTVSYEAAWTASGRRNVATVALGYADGYPRNAGTAGVAIVRDRVVPIAGRVTMDMIMLDVTDAGVEVGDIVTLVGNGSRLNAPIDVAAVASLAGMSPYELLTGLRSRLRRIYRN